MLLKNNNFRQNFGLLILLLSLVDEVKAQENYYKYDEPLTCTYLTNGIIDSNLYHYKNGRLIINVEGWNKNLIIKLIINEKSYYVSDRLGNIIKTLLEKENCKNIVVTAITENEKKNIIRD